MTLSVVPNALQASVCDEQLMSVGGEIALSGNKRPRHKLKENREKLKENEPENREKYATCD